MMKFTTNHNKYFKEWRCGDLRILNDVYANTFYRYELQRHDGVRWAKVRSFHTLAEAKKAAAWIAENLKMDAERMA